MSAWEIMGRLALVGCVADTCEPEKEVPRDEFYHDDAYERKGSSFIFCFFVLARTGPCMCGPTPESSCHAHATCNMQAGTGKVSDEACILNDELRDSKGKEGSQPCGNHQSKVRQTST